MKIFQSYQSRFRQYLEQLGYGKSSINMLPNCVQEFLEYCNITEIKNIKTEQIQSFYEYLNTRPHKRKSTNLSEIFIHHNIYALKLFFNWLEQTGQIKYNPISNLKFKKPIANSREPLSKQDIIQLFEVAENTKEIAILHLFYSLGLRRTEAENLNTTDIHFTQNLVYIRAGKGAKRRVIPITEKVKRELQNYQLSKEKMNNNEAFILNARNKRMSGDSYNIALQAIVKRTEFYNYQITLHHLRHSIATHLLENGLKIEYVRDFLGHTHLESTQIYAKVNQQMINFK